MCSFSVLGHLEARFKPAQDSREFPAVYLVPGKQGKCLDSFLGFSSSQEAGSRQLRSVEAVEGRRIPGPQATLPLFCRFLCKQRVPSLSHIFLAGSRAKSSKAFLC